MPRILLWNIQAGKAIALVRSVCLENDVDIAILVEDDKDRSKLSRSMTSQSAAGQYVEFAPVPSPIRIFTRLDLRRFAAVADRGRVSIRSYSPPFGPSFLLVACHVPSKLRRDTENQYAFVRRMRSDIEEAEKATGFPSVVIGDLNMSPYETPVLAADGLHGIPYKQVAARGHRIFDGQKWSFFYNPMFRLMISDGSHPPGTYFYNTSQLINTYWHTFDQVLVRPTLSNYLREEDLKVVSSIGNVALADERSVFGWASDHLPLLVNLDVEGHAP